MKLPILEFDPDPRAVIEPTEELDPLPEMPPHVLLCFFREVIEALVASGEAKLLHTLRSEMGPHPIYRWERADGTVAILHPGVGAPIAVGLMEESRALGGRVFLACGGAGALRDDLAVGTPIIPLAALRDEGTSYHYMPPTRWVHPAAEMVRALEQTLEAHGRPYLLGKTWTTDAFFRETPGKVARRREEGCLTVEMEAASLFAVGRFRGVRVAALLYAGDDVSGEAWDTRDWHRQEELRMTLCQLAAEALLKVEV